MTTYRAISDTEVAVDAPVTQQLVQALKDNVLAIAEGDSTAPNGGRPVSLQAIDTDAVTSNTNGATTESYQGFAISLVGVSRNFGGSNTFTGPSAAIKILRSGQYTCHLSAKGFNGQVRVRTNLYVNGTLTAFTAGAETTTLFYHAVLDLQAGDELYIQGEKVAFSGVTVVYHRLRLICDNPLENVQPSIFLESNGTSFSVEPWVAEP